MIPDIVNKIDEKEYVCFDKQEDTLGFYRISANTIQDFAALKIGWDRILNSFFIHEIPTEGEIEHAINDIEEVLMRNTHLANSKKLNLYTDDEELAGYLDADEKGISEYTRDEIEADFSRYALLSMGRSPAYEGVMMESRKYAALLVLREVMHHLDFPILRIVKGEEK